MSNQNNPSTAHDLLVACKRLVAQLESVRDVSLGLGDDEDYAAIEAGKTAIANAERVMLPVTEDTYDGDENEDTV